MKKKLILLILLIAIILIGTGCGIYFHDKYQTEMRKQAEEAINNAKDDIRALNNYLGYAYPIEDVYKLDAQDVLLFGYQKLDNVNKNKGFSAEELKATIEKYFGDYSYTDTNIECPLKDGSLFIYENGTYKAKEDHSHHVHGFARSKLYILSNNFDEKAKTITITAKALYCDFADDSYGVVSHYYANYNDSLNKKNVLYTDPNPSEDFEKFDEVYEIIKDKLPTITYKLSKDKSGHYSYKSIIVE